MEALDTSKYSTDGNPVTSCANLDLAQFPEHTCQEVTDENSFKAIAYGAKKVSIVMNDIVVHRTFEPYIASTQESRIIIGLYDPDTKRPVLVSVGSPAPSTLLGWNSAKDSEFTVINLRMKAGNCLDLTDRGTTRTLTGISLTGKCTGRFMMSSWEDTEPLDNSIYFKNIMARAMGSHTIYLDRTYLNWVEDSIIMGAWTPGKHSAKYTGQNVVVRNTLHSNEGTHGQPIDDADWTTAKPGSGFGLGGLAPISMASCNRAVLDGVTVVNHVIYGNSNPQAIQWQFRDAIGAGCDMPKIYKQLDGTGPQNPYYGLAWYNGKFEEPSSAWSAEFWEDPEMLNSYVVNSLVIQKCELDNGHGGGCTGLMTDGTFPSVRDYYGASVRHIPTAVPEGWKERQRISVANTVFDIDNGGRPARSHYNHVLTGMGRSGVHDYDNTDKFIEEDKAAVTEKMNKYIDSLPQPLWW